MWILHPSECSVYFFLHSTFFGFFFHPLSDLHLTTPSEYGLFCFRDQATYPSSHRNLHLRPFPEVKVLEMKSGKATMVYKRLGINCTFFGSIIIGVAIARPFSIGKFRNFFSVTHARPLGVFLPVDPVVWRIAIGPNKYFVLLKL